MGLEGAVKFAAEHPGKALAVAGAVGLGTALSPQFVPVIAKAAGVAIPWMTAGKAVAVGGTITAGGAVGIGIAQTMH